MRKSLWMLVGAVSPVLVLSACQDASAPGAETSPAADAATWAAGLPGDGDGQGDAKVAGTNYNATAQVRCSGYKGAGAALCDAGVVRGQETGPYVEIKLPDGAQRIIFFEKSGKFLSFGSAEADGTAAMEPSSRREGDTTIAMLGTERYEIPDAFVMGD